MMGAFRKRVVANLGSEIDTVNPSRVAMQPGLVRMAPFLALGWQGV